MEQMLYEYEDEIYMLIICLGVLLIAVIFFTLNFFLVMIKGAIEENDETYDFLSVGRIKYKNGRWQLNLKNFFDENAVVRLKFGWIFLSFFGGWDIEGLCAGDKKGVIREKTEQNMKMLRRRIRRV